MSEYRQTLIVVGNGMVGHRFCEELRELDVDGRYRVIVFGDEPRVAYDRVHLSSYFEDGDSEKLALSTTDWYAEQDVELRLGEKVIEIDRARKAVKSDKGDEFLYDVLVLATGSYPFVPPINGKEKPGVFVYRTIEDLEQIREYAAGCEAGAVLGGGLLGLEAAKAVQDMGLRTHVLEVAPRLMPRQLDDVGARLLTRAIEDLGVEVHTQAMTKEIIGDDRATGLALADGTTIDCGLIVVSCGIRPRDELARAAGLDLHPRGGILVDDALKTSDESIYAIGECVIHKGMLYGLVGPGYSMAKAVAQQLTGTPASFEGADMSTKLKLLGVDVCSFGDAFADETTGRSVSYEDKVAGVYKKLTVSEDGTRILGGQLVGDAEDYMRLLGFVNGGGELKGAADELLFGARGAEELELTDDTQICSCNNITKLTVVDVLKSGKATDLVSVKKCTKAGTGCGGCMPLVTTVVNDTLASMGLEVKKGICEHFDFTRQEMFHIIKTTGIKTFGELLMNHGSGFGCEICKPTAASIFASIENDMILDEHSTLQDTNDRFLANIQRKGLYSVVPRVAGGEITPEGLIALGQIAKKYELYTKITGGQRIDMFGAQLNQLPDIWEELVKAGFESGHAYAKALRTVKSCVGTTWCRYGQQDSVGMAILLENRYKGLRSPHKLKSAVSGCIRECAEAQSKDFGLIATDKGYNVYVGGNGGSVPRHADLLAADIDAETAIKYIDRFLMFYVRTADKLQRTARWLENLEGGLEYLKQVIIEDKLGICADLERDMQHIVDSYACEWAEVVKDPEKRARFRHFANDGADGSEATFSIERGQKRLAPWPADGVPTSGEEGPMSKSVRHLPVMQSQWVQVAEVGEVPADGGIAIKYGKAQIAVFNFASRGEWYAVQNQCPHKQDMVLARGIVGDVGGTPKVACPMHKKQFDLATGQPLGDHEYSVHTFPVKIDGGFVYLELPAVEEVEGLLCKATCDEEVAAE